MKQPCNKCFDGTLTPFPHGYPCNWCGRMNPIGPIRSNVTRIGAMHEGRNL